MKTLRTRPSPHYLPPTPEEMRAMAQKVGLKTYSREIVEDVCNLTSGGAFAPPSEYEALAKARARAKLASKDATPENVKAVEARAVKYHQNVVDFLSSMKLDNLPGATPLEQAMNLLKLLAKKGGKGSPANGDEETLPIFQEGKPENEAKDLNNLMDEVDSLDQEEKELLDEDGKDAELQRMSIAEDLAGDRAKRVMLQIARKLDSLSAMKVSRENKFVPDPDGDEVRQRPMADMNELARIRSASWGLYTQSKTLFMYKAVKKEFTVRERVNRVVRKQLLYLLIDCSGSMRSGDRVATACGVLMNRLKAVLEDQAVVFWRLFDDQLRGEEHRADSKESAKKSMEALRAANFSGGGTAVASCAKEALKRIEEIAKEGETYRPELLIVTDGDNGSCSLTRADLGATKLHVVLVGGCKNQPLTDLAVRSGGVGLNL